MNQTTDGPPAPQSVEELEDNLSTPSDGVVATLRELEGDLLILGVGGKMGPTLARMAKRASDAAGVKRRVIGVSRFSSAPLQERLESWGVETIACDLLDEDAVDRLPEARNVVFMTGLKFGASSKPALTWAMNCFLPALVSRRFRNSRIAVFSSGNVYGMTPVNDGGSTESDLAEPIGEYAMSVLGRERMFEYFGRQYNIPMAILRLNYSTELRYGVLVDLAEMVRDDKPIDLTTGYVNVIWQADANAISLQSLAYAANPPLVINIAGTEILRVRDVGKKLGRLMKKPVCFTGHEATNALISDATKSFELIERPSIGAEQMIQWTAEWVMRSGESLAKATHFASRDGKF